MNTKINSYSDYNASARLICRGVKMGFNAAYILAAKRLAHLLPENAVLIPMPSHFGCALQIKEFADILSQMTGCKVADILKCRFHESMYELKKNGKFITKEEMGFYLDGSFEEGLVPVVLDNVIGSGLTAECAVEAIGECEVLVYAKS